MARRRKPILRFFKRKVMDEQTQIDPGVIDPQVIEETPASEQVDIPEETVVTDEVEEATPDVVTAIEEEEGTQDENTDMVEKKTEVSEPASSEDRSEYNCPTCSGEGLVNEQRCTQCGGTGKV